MLRGIIPSAVRDWIVRPTNFSALSFRNLGLTTTYKFQCTSFLKFESHNKTWKRHNRFNHAGQRGVSALEMAMILPVLILIICGIIDFGRLFEARIVLTNIAREGGSIASRHLSTYGAANYDARQLITMLQQGSRPPVGPDLVGSGKIYIWRINAGSNAAQPYPSIDTSASASASAGNLAVASSIGSNLTKLGLCRNQWEESIYDHLTYYAGTSSADLSELNVVEVFYKFTPLLPVPYMKNSMILSSRALF
ncbi:MAG: pilus assembly protein [Deltaproteobacteria bacterium]|nr:pilus assembly protein [Deltaproteobacteria bacterium]